MSAEEFESRIVYNMPLEEILQKITRNGVKDTEDLSDLWFADANHYWFNRYHYLFVHWIKRVVPLIWKTTVTVLKYYLDHLPFFAIWIVALFIWLAIEVVVGSADFFNVKHTHTLLSYSFIDFKLNIIFEFYELVYTKNSFLRSLLPHLND